MKLLLNPDKWILDRWTILNNWKSIKHGVVKKYQNFVNEKVAGDNEEMYSFYKSSWDVLMDKNILI